MTETLLGWRPCWNDLTGGEVGTVFRTQDSWRCVEAAYGLPPFMGRSSEFSGKTVSTQNVCFQELALQLANTMVRVLAGISDALQRSLLHSQPACPATCENILFNFNRSLEILRRPSFQKVVDLQDCSRYKWRRGERRSTIYGLHKTMSSKIKICVCSWLPLLVGYMH